MMNIINQLIILQKKRRMPHLNYSTNKNNTYGYFIRNN
jgi:hypothetical protein